MAPVTLTRKQGIGLIEIDNPPVNATGHAVRDGLLAAVIEADGDVGLSAIVIAAAGKTFVAGADITEFGKPPLTPLLGEVLNRIEVCAKPVVVAWHGTALGAGCEIGLAAHARVIAPDGRIGLPEVKLGLVPGAGGTQRLPRLVGVPVALALAGSGRMVSAQEALALGIVDQVAEGDLRAEAMALARRLVGAPLRRTGALEVPPVDAARVDAEEAALRGKTRGQPAPVEIARLVRLAAQVPLAEGLAEERRTFLALAQGEASQALRALFFAERAAGKRADLESLAPLPVHAVGVVGAGTMGAGIAVALLDGGYAVTVIETTPEALQRGRDRIEGLLARARATGRLDAEGLEARKARLTFATDLAALSGSDLVIEAVFEEMAVKIDLFGRLDAILRPDCVRATNTSYLDINVMADALARPQTLVGLHFFSPAHVMRLLEVVEGRHTAPAVLATALSVGRRLKKIAVVAGVCEGFIGNRIFARYREACEFMLEDGALPQEIDAAFEAYGFPMGPFTVSDLAGLDISWARRKRLAPTRPKDARYVPLADRLCEMGRFGQKTGAGWYLYPEGKRSVDPMVDSLVRAHAAQSGRPQQVFTAEAIMARVLEVMGEEGAAILAEGIATQASDIDLVLVHGYGFPAHKGGPMFQRARTRTTRDA